jgi:hypothetical protein
MLANFECSRTIAQAVSHRIPTAAAPGSIPGQVMWAFWCTKRYWGRLFPSTSVSPASHYTGCSTLIIIHHPGLVQ